ncbi:Alkane hydroxylase MAH1 [Vitis vinifera]|uniref:Alkane hydroxylase MAH1 n=1 Tax=Vitis vinifera TaxID=29760 RepID=A0A438JIJ7_VITVI|nr:Alkane hydroxylase MAH1 [Vitis vinifera]
MASSWDVAGLFCNVHRIQHYATQRLKLCPTFEFKGPWFSSTNFVITSDPANVHYMLSTNFSNFQKGSNFKKIFGDILGDGIFASESDSWATQRRLIHSVLKNGRFQQLLEKTTRKKVEKGQIPILEHVSMLGLEVDMQDLFSRFTFDNTCILVLGLDPEMASNRKEKKVSRAVKVIEDFVFHCISLKQETLRGKRTRIKEDEEGSFDFLTAYMEKDGELTGGLEISDKFLRDTAINLLVAGQDTVSAALSWFFWLIATHPLVENKIWEEIKANLREKDDEIWWAFSAQEVSKLVYLHAALCETLRLFPPVPFEHKAPVKADILPSGHKIDPDTKVLFSLYAMGRMEDIWGPDCLEFKPERWISERGGIVHVPSHKFIAFNAGPRSCLGKEMTFTQMKIVAIAVICNYHVQLVEGHSVSPSISVVLHMRHGLKVRVSKRRV